MAEKEIMLFESADKSLSLSVPFDNETVWLNRQQMASLFDRDVKTIGKHVKNAIDEELQGLPTVAKFATVQTEGERNVEREVEYYNLDVIISVGYRVKSKRGIEFRKWANSVLKQYILKGYAANLFLFFHKPYFLFIISLEDFFSTLASVAVFQIAVFADFIFFQNPDNIFRKALVPAGSLKKADHLRTNSCAQK